MISETQSMEGYNVIFYESILNPVQGGIKVSINPASINGGSDGAFIYEKRGYDLIQC